MLVARMTSTSLRKMKKRSRNCNEKRGKGKDEAVRFKLEPIYINGPW